MWFDVFMIACGVVVIAGVCGLLVDRHWLVVDWWPLIGPEWRAERHDRLQLQATRQEIAAVIDLPGPQYDPGGNVPHEWRNMQAGELDEDDPDDESWADELHAINQELHGNVITGQFGDLTRPVHELTHYEVEAVIRQLGRADWLPAAA